MNHLLTECPVCSGELTITRLECATCNTAVEGTFHLGRLARLSREQLQFATLLAQHRGNVNQVAASMGVSYTTARTRMDEIATALGAPQVVYPAADHRDILRQLEEGRLSAEQALRLLEGEEQR